MVYTVSFVPQRSPNKALNDDAGEKDSPARVS